MSKSEVVRLIELKYRIKNFLLGLFLIVLLIGAQLAHRFTDENSDLQYVGVGVSTAVLQRLQIDYGLTSLLKVVHAEIQVSKQSECSKHYSL